MGVREALLRAGIASAAQIDEALARQQLYGADIVTNLLELVELDETNVQRALAEGYGMALAPAGELPYAAGAAIALVPRSIAVDMNVYPFRLDDGVLTVVSAAPIGERAAGELGFALKVQLRAVFAVAPRIKQAIARDYAFALDRRTQKAIGKLDRLSQRPATEAPPPMPEVRTVSQFPRPRSIAPFGFPEDWANSKTPDAGRVLVETARQPEVRGLDPNDLKEAPETSRSVFGQYPSRPEFPGVAPETAEPATLRRAPSSPPGAPPPSQRTHRRRGPYTITDAKEDLTRTSTGDEVLEVFFDFAAQFFDYAVAFALHGDEAEPREARGHGPGLSDLPERLMLADSSALRQATDGSSWVLVSLGPADEALARALWRETSLQCLLLPISVRNRVVVVLFGGFDDEPVELAQVGDLLAFRPLVRNAFEHAILARKGQSSTTNLVGFQPLRQRFAAPSAEERAKALAALLSGNRRDEGTG
jgi:hypothetical protein